MRIISHKIISYNYRSDSDFSESTLTEAEKINQLLRNKDVLLAMSFNVDVQLLFKVKKFDNFISLNN